MTGGQHPRRDLARHQEVAGQVGVDDRAEPLWRHRPEPLRFRQEPRIDRAHADPGVVDQQIDAAEPGPCLINGPMDRVFVTDVELQAGRAGQAPGRFPGPVRRPASQDDGRARGGERGHHGQAQATASPGDEDTEGGKLGFVGHNALSTRTRGGFVRLRGLGGLCARVIRGSCTPGAARGPCAPGAARGPCAPGVIRGSCAPGAARGSRGSLRGDLVRPAAEAVTEVLAVTIHPMRDRENTGPPNSD